MLSSQFKVTEYTTLLRLPWILFSTVNILMIPVLYISYRYRCNKQTCTRRDIISSSWKYYCKHYYFTWIFKFSFYMQILPQYRFSGFIWFSHSKWTWINANSLRHKITRKRWKKIKDHINHCLCRWCCVYFSPHSLCSASLALGSIHILTQEPTSASADRAAKSPCTNSSGQCPDCGDFS